MTQFIEYRGFDHVFQYSGPWLWWLIGIYLTLPLTAYIIIPYFTSKGVYSGKRRTISIFVLGDLGHSPRMCYHARSFSKLEYFVNLCGYLETQPPEDIIDDVNIEISPIQVIRNTHRLPFVIFAAQKIVTQFVQLVKLLLSFRGSDYIMIQNPPSVPILIVVIVFINLFSRNSKLVIDWHNLNYTMLNMRFQNLRHPLVRAVKLYEKYLGRFAYLNLTVTKKMKIFLAEEFSIQKSKIVVLYDRPAYQFHPIDKETKQITIHNHDLFNGVDNLDEYKIVVSSTSFTPDEDFNVLLKALKKYDLNKKSPPVFLLVTGKGPLREQFLEHVDELLLTNKVIIKSAWLSSEDYPKLLATADLGVSLHTSSSGIDLPMKIVDFFGCGVPVVSLNFPSIDELVKQNYNGLVTSPKDSSIDESDEVYNLLIMALTNDKLLSSLKEGAIAESKLRWDENWSQSMNSHFEYDIN